MSSLDSLPPASEGTRAEPLQGHAAPADYLERNRAAWNRWAVDHMISARRAWTASELRWGLWSIPESELRLLADLPVGADVIELGSGAGATCAGMARHGFRPVAVDFAPKQLEVGARLQKELGPTFPLVRANADDVPYDLESFDLVISEYGASLWCDPRSWLPEAARILRPGGVLTFIVNSPLLMACTPDDGGPAYERLLRDSFESVIRTFDDGVVEFHPSHSEWVRLLRRHGFVIEDMLEVRPPGQAKPRYELASLEWARRWPSEDIWVARKTG